LCTTSRCEREQVYNLKCDLSNITDLPNGNNDQNNQKLLPLGDFEVSLDIESERSKVKGERSKVKSHTRS